MFDPEFFPTPAALARQLCAPYQSDDRIASILDPSAGKGDLLKRFVGGSAKLYAIERSPELRAILQAARTETRYVEAKPLYHVLGDDIFEYAGRHRFDLIVMNPPFSNGADHVLRALELLADGGRLACILNAETVRNPCDKKRQLLTQTIERMGGNIEYVKDAFANAERRTNVEVAIVRLTKPAAAGEAFNFAAAAHEKSRKHIDDVNVEDLEGQLAKPDAIGNMAVCFDKAAEAMADLARAWKKAEFYLSGLDVGMHHVCPLERHATVSPDNLNSMIDGAQMLAWRNVITRCKLDHLFTAKMQTDFQSFAQKQGALDFNATNIKAMLRMLLASRTKISEQCVTDVFDKMCDYDKENVIHPEGWKTNSGHKVNKKVILPRFISHDYFGFRLSYYGRPGAELDDIDKAMCHVTGKSFHGVKLIRVALEEAFRNKGVQPGYVDTEFFTVRFFKKGTLHLKFKDAKVWELFNVAAAKGRGWIGKAA